MGCTNHALVLLGRTNFDYAPFENDKCDLGQMAPYYVFGPITKGVCSLLYVNLKQNYMASLTASGFLDCPRISSRSSLERK